MESNGTKNPLLQGNPDQVAKRILGLLPTAQPMSPEEQAQFDQECADGRKRYVDARFGDLPQDTYRILEFGDIGGWRLELEIESQSVLLIEPDEDSYSAYKVYENKQRAEELARAEIARRIDAAHAQRAQFRYVWGGSL